MLNRADRVATLTDSEIGRSLCRRSRRLTLHVAGFHSADKYQLRRTSTMAFLAFGD